MVVLATVLTVVIAQPRPHSSETPVRKATGDKVLTEGLLRSILALYLKGVDGNAKSEGLQVIRC
jgi:hypothetical protein